MITKLKEIIEEHGLKHASELDRPTRLETGIKDLDNLLGGGWQPGLNIVRGEAGTGKSLILASTMAHHLRQRVPVISVDTENSYGIWQHHLPIESAWTIPQQENAFLNYGFDLAITQRRITEYVEHAIKIGHPIGAVFIDSIDAMLARYEHEKIGGFTYKFGRNMSIEQRATDLSDFIMRLARLGQKHNIPIVATRHNYENDNGPVDDRIKKVIDGTSKIVISTSTFAQHHNNHDNQNTPHITPGRRIFRVSQIDYRNPTHLILGVTVDRNPKYKTSSSILPVTIAMDDLTNFRYSQILDPSQSIRDSFRHGIDWGNDAEPDDTDVGSDQSDDETLASIGNDWAEWDGSEQSESRPTSDDPLFSKWT